MIREIKRNRLYSKVIEYLYGLEFMDGGDDIRLFYVDGMTYVYRVNKQNNDIIINLYQLDKKFGGQFSEDEYLKIIKIKHNIE